MKLLLITALLLITSNALGECDDSERACPAINIDRQCLKDCRDEGYSYGYCLKECSY